MRATPPRLHARPPGLTNTRFDHCTSTGQKTARQAACRLPPAAAGEHPRRTAFPARAPAPPRAVRRPPESPPPAAARPAPPLESAKRPPPAPLPVRVTIGRGGGRGKRAPACPTRKSQPQRRAHERQTPREHKNPHARARTCTQTPRASVPAAPTPPALRRTCRRPASAVPPRRPVDLHHPPASHASTPPLIVARRHRAAHRQGFVIASTPPLIDEVNISSSGRCPRARPPPRVSSQPADHPDPSRRAGGHPLSQPRAAIWGNQYVPTTFLPSSLDLSSEIAQTDLLSPASGQETERAGVRTAAQRS